MKEQFPADTVKVLLIEDEEVYATLLRHMLAECDFEMVRRKTLKAGLKTLRESGFDLVLLDLNLPDSLGEDTFEKLIRAFPEIPVIVLTQIEDEKSAIKLISRGSQDYLVKNRSDKEYLERAIRYSLARKQVETALHESELRNVKIVESALDAIITIDEEENVVEINPSAKEMFGYPRDEALGKNIVDLVIPPDKRDKHRHGFKRYLETGESRILGKRIELRAMRSGGAEFPVELTVTTYRMGGQRYFTAYIRDITKRKQSEEALRRSEEQFSKAFHASPGLSAISDPDTGEHYNVNDNWVSTLGYSRQEAIGKTALEMNLWVDKKDRATLVETLKKEGSIRDFETRLRTKDGEVRDILVAGGMIELEGRRRLLLFGLDVTERKSYEDELCRAKEEAEFANHAKTQFLANMSHELRTPLNSIIGFADMIKSETYGPLGDVKYQEYAGDISGASTHLLGVITDLLDVSKIETGTLDLNEEGVSLNRTVVQCMRLSQKRADAANVELSMDVPFDLPLLRADPLRVKQIVLNLLSNGIKFTPMGGRVAVESSLDEQGAILLEIKDTGKGIPAEDIPGIFEPFSTTENIMTRSHEGSGLGLPISKRLAELHGGALSIESETGKGTTVTVRFPPERTIAG